MPQHLVIIRHGNTFDPGDVVLRVGKRTDLPLSKSGVVQAQQLGLHLKSEGLLPSIVLTSTLKRTQETAMLALQSAGHAATIRHIPELDEIDYGPDDGQPEDAVIQRLGEDTIRHWDQFGTMPMDWSPRPNHIRQNLNNLLKDLSADLPHRYWIVTSNGIGRFIPELCHNGGPDENNKLKTGAYGVLDLAENEEPTLLKWNIRAP